MTRPIRKIKDEAARLLRRGKYDRALEQYQELARRNPDDYSSRRNLGYILRKLGRRQEAAQVFVELANEYAGDGFLLKAIATCKVVLEIDPEHTETQQQLAELYSSRTATPTPQLRVMADNAPVGEMAAGGMASQAMGLATDAIELPAAEEASGLEMERTTDLDDLQAAAAGPAAAAERPSTGRDSYIEMIELEPIPLEDDPRPRSDGPAAEPAATPSDPVMGTLIEPTPGIAPVPADELDLTPEPAAEAELPEIELDEAFELDEPEPKQQALAPEIPLFCELEPDAFVALLERMNVVRMKPGQWLLREGDAGSSMYTIASGKVRVLKRIAPRKLLQLAVLGEGTFFGEMSLLRGGIRGASVQALEQGELFEVSRDLIEDVARQYPAVAEVLNRFAHQRLLRNAMSTSPLFSPFSKKERIQIIERFVSRPVAAGEELVTEGVESDGLYLVLRGRMEVSCAADGSEPLVVGELAEGEVFGEISCLRKEPAIATVRAKTAGSVLRLPRAEFDRLVSSHPQVLVLVSELSDERLAQTSNLLAQKGILI